MVWHVGNGSSSSCLSPWDPAAALVVGFPVFSGNTGQALGVGCASAGNEIMKMLSKPWCPTQLRPSFISDNKIWASLEKERKLNLADHPLHLGH